MTTSEEFSTRFRPRSTSDSIDGDNSKEGACTAITNLIFDPSTPGVTVCRPAVEQLNLFTGFDNPGVVSAGLQLSGVVYGLVASSRFPGYDEPFAFDIPSGDFLPIVGVNSSNVPLSQPAAGDWTPPDAVALETKVVFTHVGFNFAGGNAFGYFDLSSFSETITGDITSGSAVVTGAPVLAGMAPGFTLSGAGIPSGTVVKDVSNVAITTYANLTNGFVLQNVSNVTKVGLAQAVSGSGISSGSIVTGINGSNVTISDEVTATNTGVSLTYTTTSTGNTNGGTISDTGSITTGSEWITGLSNIAEGVVPGATIAGTGIPAGATAVDVFANAILMSIAATATNASVAVTFSATATNLYNVVNTQGAVVVGQTVTGTGIPSATTVTGVNGFVVSISQAATANAQGVALTFTTTGTANLVEANVLEGVVSPSQVAVGQAVTGAGIQAATIVTGVSGSTVTMSNPATSIATQSEIFFTGTTITMSKNATATASGLTITIAGGTPANPLWNTGNLLINPLPTQPTCIGTFDNRFYFGCGQVLAWSDTLALSATDSDQAVFIGDVTPITAISPMTLSTTTQAVLDGLMVFKQNYLTQLTGDPALNNLELNLVSDEIGTAAPRSLGLCPDGLHFMAVDGIRKVQLSGIITDPDEDLALPFIYSLFPSRVSAAFNNNTYRICTQNNSPASTGTPIEEYWNDLKRGGWTGPHTFPQDLVLPYGNTFITFSNTFSPSIWQSDVVQSGAETFNEPVGGTGTVVFYVAEDGVTPYVTEDGSAQYIAEGGNTSPMVFLLETVPMTDFDNPYANTLMNSTLDMAIPGNGISYLLTAMNEIYSTICTATITAPATAPIWGQFTWGLATWGALAFGLQPQTIPWPIPIVFNRLALSVSGQSSAGFKLGSFHMVSKRLKYLLH